jgi:hypothetical protein
MQDTAKVMEMAGYWAAHSIWSVCDGETLIPIVGYLAADDSCSMERLAMGPVAALVHGEHKLSSLEPCQQGAVLIKEGRIGAGVGAEKTHCLILDVRFAAAPHSKLQYVLPYRSGLHELGFAVHNPVLGECQGFDAEQVEILGQFFFKGLAAHTQGSAIWHSHYQPQVDLQGDPAGRFTLEELQLLRRAPLLVYVLLRSEAGETPTLARLSELLAAVGRYLNPLLSRLVNQPAADCAAQARAMLARQVDALGELRVIRQVIDACLPAVESRAFAQALLALAADLAEGTQQRVLNRLESALGLSDM